MSVVRRSRGYFVRRRTGTALVVLGGLAFLGGLIEDLLQHPSFLFGECGYCEYNSSVLEASMIFGSVLTIVVGLLLRKRRWSS